MKELIVNEVEYAYNIDQSANSDLTSFGYGPEGVNFGTFADGTLGYCTKKVQFKTPIDASDIISMQLSNDSGASWFDIGTVYTKIEAGNDKIYGIWLNPSSSTEVSVLFGRLGVTVGSAVFGDQGDQYVTSLRWRVKKSRSANAGLVTAADATRGGVLSNTTQEIAGDKTFKGFTTLERSPLAKSTDNVSRINLSSHVEGQEPYSMLAGDTNGFDLLADQTKTIVISKVPIPNKAFLLVVSFHNAATASSAVVLCGYQDFLTIISATNEKIAANVPPATGIALSYNSTSGTLTIVGGSSLAVSMNIRILVIGNGV